MALRRSIAAAVFAIPLVLSACGGEDSPEVSSSTVAATPTTAAKSAELPLDVNFVLGALDQPDAEYAQPEEEDPEELSGARRSFSLDIVGHGAGINLFTEPEGNATWQEAFDGLGGVSVTFDTTAVSLNSEEGKGDSLALAPRLAEALGGEAHTGETVSEEEVPIVDIEQPTKDPYVVECRSGAPEPALRSDGTTAFSQACFDEATEGCGYRCPQTDHYVSDPAQCETSWQDPATIPFADGGTCAAVVCRYGHNALGNPNPFSGEIQGRHMCQEGKVGDPEYCDVIEDVFANNVDWG